MAFYLQRAPNMNENILDEVETYMDNRDSYTVKERKEIRRYFREQLLFAKDCKPAVP